MHNLFMFADRRSAPAFWLGTLLVVTGVLLHIPVFLMGRAIGGLICQGLSALAAVPLIGTAAIAIGIPVLMGFGLIAIYGRETRGQDLRKLERAVAPATSSLRLR